MSAIFECFSRTRISILKVLHMNGFHFQNTATLPENLVTHFGIFGSGVICFHIKLPSPSKSHFSANIDRDKNARWKNEYFDEPLSLSSIASGYEILLCPAGHTDSWLTILPL